MPDEYLLRLAGDREDVESESEDEYESRLFRLRESTEASESDSLSLWSFPSLLSATHSLCSSPKHTSLISLSQPF